MATAVFDFEVLETLEGRVADRVRVATGPEARQVPSEDLLIPRRPKVACGRWAKGAMIAGELHNSPFRIVPDPKLDYLLMVMAGSGEVVGPWVAMFGIIDHPTQIRKALTGLPDLLKEERALGAQPPAPKP